MYIYTHITAFCTNISHKNKGGKHGKWSTKYKQGSNHQRLLSWLVENMCLQLGKHLWAHGTKQKTRMLLGYKTVKDTDIRFESRWLRLRLTFKMWHNLLLFQMCCALKSVLEKCLKTLWRLKRRPFSADPLFGMFTFTSTSTSRLWGTPWKITSFLVKKKKEQKHDAALTLDTKN